MINSIQSDFRIGLRVWGLSLIFVIGSFAVLASDSSSIDETAIHIVLTPESIHVDTAAVCSTAELKAVLNARLRSTPVAVEATADSSTEIVFTLRKILSDLGFESVTYEGVGSPGWGLYPPSADIVFPGCDQHRPKDTVEVD